MKNKFDIYQKITDSVISSLESGTIPWKKPWVCCGARGLPRSGATGKPYNGVNHLLTSFAPYESVWWLTYKQCEALGGNLKGQKGTQIIKWIFPPEEKELKASDDKKKRPFMKCFTVFNLEQCKLPDKALAWFAARLDDIAPEMPEYHERESGCLGTYTYAVKVSDDYLERENIKLSHKGDSAFYAPLDDRIVMPNENQFSNYGSYLATLFHEEVHSTGHSSRLNRGNDTRNRSSNNELQEYSREELVAEIGSSFICGMLGVGTSDIDTNRDAYIKGWLKKLKDDKKAIALASSAAAKASDYILNMSPCEGDIEFTHSVVEGVANG